MTTGNLYDYRVTVEFTNSEANDCFLSADKIEEGQVITARGRRCLVSNVAPDPQVHPGEAQIIFVHCKVVDELPG